MTKNNTEPDQFDDLVRDTLRDVDGRTRPDSGLADRLIANAREGQTTVVPLRRRTGWVAPLLAAAAVIAVAVGLVVAANNRGTSDNTAPPATRNPTPAPTSSTYPTPAPSVPGFRSADVSYLDAEHGWAIGDGPCESGGTNACATLLRTTDGGQSWQKITVPPGLTSTRDEGSCGSNGTIHGPCVDQVVFASRSNGYLWSFHTLYLTTDSGAHWTDTGTEHVVNVVTFGDTVARMTTKAGCSAGCSYGVQYGPVGTTQWTTAVPFSAGGTVAWDLEGVPGTAYLLEQFPGTDEGSTGPQRVYRSTDGQHWVRVTTKLPCGTRGIYTISVSTDGAWHATCF